MQPWYLTPAALRIIGGITAKPATETHTQRFPMVQDRWNTFVGEEVDALGALWSAAFVKAENAAHREPDAALAVIRATPEDVLGAMFGDPNGNEWYRTHRDASPEWAAIRDTVQGAMLRRAA